MALLPIQVRHHIGPARPMPFPDSGKMVKLLICPRCRLKKVPYFYAPREHGYRTKCLSCGSGHVIKPKDVSFREIREHGGMMPRREGIVESQRWGLDATRMYEETRDLLALGFKKAYRQGAIGRRVDAGLI